MNLNGNPMRLLAVDDDVTSAELIVRVAERCRFEAFATSDSRGVLNLMSALKPDMVSIDICMPNLDANDLLVLLSERKFDGQILVVSGQEPRVLHETRDFAVSLGLNRPQVLQKPLDLVTLRELLVSCNQAKAA